MSSYTSIGVYHHWETHEKPTTTVPFSVVSIFPILVADSERLTLSVLN
jgi:hypothetical protein